MLLFLLFLKLFPVLSVPISEPRTLFLEPNPRRFDRLISSVVRQIGESDIIHPSVCPSSCEHLHQAVSYIQNHSDISLSVKECSCICPQSRPAYVSTVAGCVDRLSDCPNTIRWKTLNSPMTVIELRPHTIILPEDDLDFRGAGIRPSPRGAEEWNCGIQKILYENLNTRWRTIPKERGLFQLTSNNGKPIVYFGGTDSDVESLSGAVVMIKLSCRTFSETTSSSFCISLRIAGTSGANSHFDNKNFDLEDGGWRIETVFLLVVVAMIIIVLIITFVVWNICWGIKKRKLISDFQMRFVQQYKVQNGAQSPNMSEFEEIDEREILQTHSLPLMKKRLIFSAEYFDPAQMMHPSPMAIQFLYDLRRVVDVAKERIRQRRFIPGLAMIIEEIEHEYESNHEDPRQEESQEESPESSPRSEQKSVDSGRGEDGDDSDEDDDDGEDQREKEVVKRNEDPTIRTQTRVSDIVKSFEKQAPPPPPPRPSYVPIMLNSSMRKKKPMSATTTSTTLDAPPPLKPKESVFQSKIRPPTAFTDRKSPRERKGYAVFPSDGTFNKSLPRRAKRFSPSQPTSTTN